MANTIEFNGEQLSVKDVASRLGIKPDTLSSRIARYGAAKAIRMGGKTSATRHKEHVRAAFNGRGALS